MDDLISIVIPVFNVKNYLANCVKSIEKQTYANLEIILVDDGSTDGSGELCNQLALKDRRIHVIHKKNGGLSSARNVGIEVAAGKYIGFVDSDDYIDGKMYETLLKKMYKYSADISICGRWYVYENGKKHLRYQSDGKDLVMNAEQAILKMNSYCSFDMAAWDKLYSKSLFDNIRFPEGKLSEDYFIMFRIFDKAKVICYTPEPLYFYIQRKGSISRSKKINFDFAEAAKEQMEYVEEKYPRLKNCVHTAYASANMTVYNFHIKNHVKCKKEDRILFQKVVADNMDYIEKNDKISSVKKIQAKIFCLNILLYNIFFRMFKFFNKI